ncbi:MAG: bifunctional phosphopantothenoylcysteine decarboxylase/phosphopantothenate--cysteine ligase CoaBC [Arcanobacterium sp.]
MSALSQRASQPGGLSHARRPRVLVGVTGGIAAYKSAILVRRLAEWGAEVTVVPTHAALDMVGKTTWEALSGRPVYVDVAEGTHEVVHVRTGQQADLVVVAPVTANTMAKIANGMADNLLTASVLVATCPIMLAPAMHTEMWLNAATQANAAILRERGFIFVGPESGRLTGPDSGPGRMSEPEDIAAAAFEQLEELGFSSVHAEAFDKHAVPTHHKASIAISAGGTREAIDPVRYIANRSTGRMGIELANAAARAGHSVRLAAANIERDVMDLLDPRVDVTPVVSAQQLAEVMDGWAHEVDCVIMAAAVADYRVEFSDVKIKRGGNHTLELIPNPDILADLTHHRRRDNQLIVGFAAETGDDSTDFITLGKEKAARKKADLIAINQVGAVAGFGDVDTRLVVVDEQGSARGDFTGSKKDVAQALMELVSTELAVVRER